MTDITEFPRYKDVHHFAEISVDDLGPWISFVGSLEENAKNIAATCDGGESCGSKWIFRGQSDASWPITSTFEREYLEWYSQFSEPERMLRQHEKLMMERFRQNACGYVNRPNMSRLDWLSLMRHYGVPTRFVDFTESPFVALYFAAKSEKSSSTDFCIWAVVRENFHNYYYEQKDRESKIYLKRICQKYPPDQFNAAINDRKSSDADIQAFHRCMDPASPNALNLSDVMSANRDGAEILLSGGGIGEDGLGVASQILSIYPALPNARMRAQSGLFLMPKKLAIPFMDSFYAWNQIPKNFVPHKLTIAEAVDKDMLFALSMQCRILKFVFQADMRAEACAVLSMANLNAHTISPDLDGVAKFVTLESACKDRIVYRNPIGITVG